MGASNPSHPFRQRRGAVQAGRGKCEPYILLGRTGRGEQVGTSIFRHRKCNQRSFWSEQAGVPSYNQHPFRQGMWARQVARARSAPTILLVRTGREEVNGERQSCPSRQVGRTSGAGHVGTSKHIWQAKRALRLRRTSRWIPRKSQKQLHHHYRFLNQVFMVFRGSAWFWAHLKD